MPTAMERLVWGMGDGSTMPVFDTPLGRMGAVICWENYMPLLRMAMYAKGIELYCAPTVDDRDTWARSMQHIAFEGRCFVLSAVQYLERRDCPEDYPRFRDDPRHVLIRGGSVIVNPQGVVLAGPHYGERNHPDRGSGPERDRRGEIRFGCRRALCASRCVSADGKRTPRAGGGV